MAEKQNKYGKYRSFRRLIDFLRPHKGSVAAGVTLLTIVALLKLIPPLGIKYIINNLLNDNGKLTDADRLIRLNIVCLGIIGLYVTIATLNRCRSMIMHILGERFILDLRLRMYSHLQKLSLTFFESRQTGEIMSRVTADSEVVEEFVTHAADTVVADALMIIGIIIILFYMSVPLAIVALIPVPILGLVTFKYSRKVRSNYRSTRERIADMSAK